jgi:heme/copper-type cytochrome/quinol oxidase subunit 3
MTGIVLQYVLFTLDLSLLRRDIQASYPLFEAPISEPFLKSCNAENGTVEETYTRPGIGNVVFLEEDIWTFARVWEMVAQTKGFLARDWPLQLGWNNVSCLSVVVYMSILLNRSSFVCMSRCDT